MIIFFRSHIITVFSLVVCCMCAPLKAVIITVQAKGGQESTYLIRREFSKLVKAGVVVNAKEDCAIEVKKNHLMYELRLNLQPQDVLQLFVYKPSPSCAGKCLLQSLGEKFVVGKTKGATILLNQNDYKVLDI